MELKKHFATLLERQMDRKDFLKNMGAIFLTVIGVAGVVRFIAQGGLGHQQVSSAQGYGSTSYGGSRK